jgi:hypothetical protein
MDTTWGGYVEPVALQAARDAEYLGDAALARRLAAQAEAMLVTLDPESLKRDRMRVMRAQVHALLDRPAEAIAETEAALKEADRVGDPISRGVTRYGAAWSFARAGSRTRALDMLEALLAERYRTVGLASIHDDPFLRRLLGAEPRYQALMKKFESEFVKP